MLYVCSDRGIPFGGSKGGSIHIREFLDALLCTGMSPELVTCRIDENSGYKPDYPVTLVTPGLTDSFFDYAAQLGYSRRAFREIRNFHRNEAMAATISTICERRSVDLIYERYSLFGVAGLTIARDLNLPFVLEVNAPLVREASEFRQLLLPDLARGVEKFLFSGADHVIAVSEQVADYVHSVATDTPVTVVPNGVSTEAHKSPDDVTLWKEKFASGTDAELIIGFVGSIRPWHGVHMLIDALAELVNRGMKVSLVLVGDNQMMLETLTQQCERLGIAERVIFTGPLPFETIPSVMAAIDILVAPYPEMDEFYFSPLKVFEYMAAGKPIVASRIGQITDILTHEKNGLLVAPGKSVEIANAIARLNDDKELRHRLANNAREDAVASHTWASRMRIITGIFTQLGCGMPGSEVGKPCG